jgi:uncharacterized protein (TIGR02246 family)
LSEIEISSHGSGISQEDIEAVLRLPTELDRTWNERNSQAFAALFDEDGDFRFHTGQWIKGRKDIERFWGEEVFPTLPGGMRHIVTTRQVRFVTGKVAIGEGTLRLVDHVEGQERVYLEAEGTMLAVKRDLHWRISAIRLATLVAG